MAEEAEAQHEPTMEEILSSIRRIISEDGEQPAPEAAPVTAPPRKVSLMRAPPAEMPMAHGMPMGMPQAMSMPEPEPMPCADQWSGSGEGLVSRDTEAAATRAFAGLAGAVSHATGVPFGTPQRTLEELVRELLRPMLKQWLDRNLQPIVARAVEREISRLSGRADKD